MAYILEDFVDVGMLFDKYPVRFPVERPLSIIHGENCTGKTQTLQLLKQYYLNKGENVLFFPTDRYFNVSGDEVESIMVMSSIADEFDVFKAFDVNLQPWDIEKIKKGDYIHGGYFQLVNILATIKLQEEPAVVIIDTIERSLHPSIRRVLLQYLFKLEKIKKLIVTTYSAEMFSGYEDYVFHIKQCVRL